jgi:hypothetical protein
MSELFTSGSVGGAAGNCCLYPASGLPKPVCATRVSEVRIH